MKIYLDVCCLCRPFDNQLVPRIKLESEAISFILLLIERGELSMVNSEIIEYEVSKIVNPEKRFKVELLLRYSEDKILVNEKIAKRALFFESKGLQSYDSLHLACAENAADILFTVDKDFHEKAKKIKDLKINIINPLEFNFEEEKNDY
jgi:predicted nucleic acid-binding protein